MEIFINAVFIILISVLVLIMTLIGFYAGVGLIIDVVKAVDALILNLKNKHNKQKQLKK